MARQLLTAPMVLALSLLATAASSDVCQVCTTICDPATLHCEHICYSTDCGGHYKLAAMLKVKEGSDCVVKDKTSRLSVPGKLNGHECVLEHPLH